MCIYIYMYSFTVFISTHHLQASQPHQSASGRPPSAGAVQFVSFSSRCCSRSLQCKMCNSRCWFSLRCCSLSTLHVCPSVPTPWEKQKEINALSKLQTRLLQVSKNKKLIQTKDQSPQKRYMYPGVLELNGGFELGKSPNTNGALSHYHVGLPEGINYPQMTIKS